MTDPAVAIAEALEAVVAPIRLEVEDLREKLREFERQREQAKLQPLLTYAKAAALIGVSHRTFQGWASARGVNGMEAQGVVVGDPPRVDPVALLDWYRRSRR